MNIRSPIFLLAQIFLSISVVAAEPGDTRIARWQDDKACVFTLMFDDSVPSHVLTVVPELSRRGLTGTFYINPGTGHYAAQRIAWEKDIPAAGFELANHTWTHKGASTAAGIAEEIRATSEAIRAATPDQPWPRLVSWGQPGGIPDALWPVSKDELAALLREHHLVPRPDFGGRGAAVGLNNAAAMLAHVDKAIASGAMECVIFHGVGAEWISFPAAEFTALLDGLVERRDRVWITGHIPAHQYATQRDAASVRVLTRTDKEIRVELSCTADPRWYERPLTLVTTVPAGWTDCLVRQGNVSTPARAADGHLRYDARPGTVPISITRR